MSSFSVVAGQLIQFFLMLALGYWMARSGVVGEEFLGDLSKLVTRLLLPMYAFSSTYQGNERQRFLDGLPVLALSALFYVSLAPILALLAHALGLQGQRRRVFQALFLFGNTAFVGMPLIQALYPGEGMVFMALFTVIDQAILWSYGLWLTDGSARRGFHPRNFANPTIIALLLAVVLVLADLQLPSLIGATVNTVGRASTAVCMIYLGAMFYFSNWKKVLREKELYLGILLKMLLVPLAVWKLLSWMGATGAMLGTMVLISALPTMTVIPMLAQSGGDEGEYAIGMTMVTLAASLITLPLISYFVL